jgi:hypothetical protein
MCVIFFFFSSPYKSQFIVNMHVCVLVQKQLIVISVMVFFFKGSVRLYSMHTTKPNKPRQCTPNNHEWMKRCNKNKIVHQQRKQDEAVNDNKQKICVNETRQGR